jgi:hypothetical protein
MRKLRSFETSATPSQTKRRHVPENVNLQQHRCENLKPHEHFIILKFKKSYFEEQHVVLHETSPPLPVQFHQHMAVPTKCHIMCVSAAILCCRNPQLQAAMFHMLTYRGMQFEGCMMKPFQTHHVCSPTVHDEALPNTPYLLSNSA